MKNFLPEAHPLPVFEKIISSFSPEQVFSVLERVGVSRFLNSSMETDTERYSFIGIDPFFCMRSKGSFINITLFGEKFTIFGSPLETLRSVSGAYHVTNSTPFPFVAGGIGYISYDAKNLIESLPESPPDDIGVPDISFVFYRCILIFDKRTPGEFYASVLAIGPDGHRSAMETLSRIKTALKKSDLTTFEKSSRPLMVSGDPRGKGLESNFTKKEYVNAVEKILEHIRRGDIYQACLSQRFKTEWPGSPYDMYLKLNSITPSPFSAYMVSGEVSIISSSPELFLRRRGGSVETRPMKGTRPAGISTSRDETVKDELEKSPEDIAELLMIVDLERNDIGRVAVPGTVRVEEHRRIERHPTVFQAISVIKAKVTDKTDNIDILTAAFPGGSITGCPKIRAMEIINELEPCSRGVYTGAMGYLSFHGTMDMNIAIRTMTLKGNTLYFHAGGGIVADSDPEEEYEETMVKARALIRAAGQDI